MTTWVDGSGVKEAGLFRISQPIPASKAGDEQKSTMVVVEWEELPKLLKGLLDITTFLGEQLK